MLLKTGLRCLCASVVAVVAFIRLPTYTVQVEYHSLCNNIRDNKRRQPVMKKTQLFCIYFTQVHVVTMQTKLRRVLCVNSCKTVDPGEIRTHDIMQRRLLDYVSIVRFEIVSLFMTAEN
jgi:hypothetical protein